jgi:hypothetical protein
VEVQIDDRRAEREVVRYELTTSYERDALRAGRRTHDGSTSGICSDFRAIVRVSIFLVIAQKLSVFTRARR